MVTILIQLLSHRFCFRSLGMAYLAGFSGKLKSRCQPELSSHLGAWLGMGLLSNSLRLLAGFISSCLEVQGPLGHIGHFPETALSSKRWPQFLPCGFFTELLLPNQQVRRSLARVCHGDSSITCIHGSDFIAFVLIVIKMTSIFCIFCG